MFFLLIASLLTQLDSELQKLNKKISNYVVMVISTEGRASGTVIDKQTVVTVGLFPENHRVQLITKGGDRISGVVKGFDDYTGIVVIQPEKYLPFPRINAKIIEREIAIVYGNSLGTLGPVGLGFVQKGGNIFKIIVPLSPGNNGSGVFDVQGRLIGIIGGTLSPLSIFNNFSLPGDIKTFTNSNAGIIIPVAQVNFIVSLINKKGSIRRPWLGISVYMKNGNVVIRDVMKNSPAERGGLKKNDIVLYVDRKKIRSPEDLVYYIKGKKPGDTIRILIIREGRRIPLKITLGKSAPPLKYRNLHIKGPETGSLLPKSSPP